MDRPNSVNMALLVRRKYREAQLVIKMSLYALQHTIDSVKKMSCNAIKQFRHKLMTAVDFGIGTLDNFKQKVLAELENAKEFIRNLDYKMAAVIGCMATGVVVGGALGIVIAYGCRSVGVAGLKTVFGAVAGAVTGGCVLFGACKAGTKWADHGLMHKMGVVTGASVVGASGGVACVTFASAAAASFPVLVAGAVVGIVVVGGAAVIGYLADKSDDNLADMKERNVKLEESNVKLENNLFDMKNDMAEMKVKMDSLMQINQQLLQKIMQPQQEHQQKEQKMQQQLGQMQK